MSLSRHANPDNLEIGSAVTVLEGPIEESSGSSHPFSALSIGTMPSSQSEDTSHHGEVMIVLAVSFPYILLQRLVKDQVKTLDLREWKLALVSDDYFQMWLKTQVEQKGRSDDKIGHLRFSDLVESDDGMRTVTFEFESFDRENMPDWWQEKFGDNDEEDNEDE